MMSNYVHLTGKVDFNKHEQDFVEFVLGNSFPWFAIMSTDNFRAMAHILMLRAKDELPVRGQVNSPFYQVCEQLFLRLCKANNITVRTIYRATINMTFADPSVHGDPHRDHEFPAKNLIIYLNEFDDGRTFLLDDDFQIVDWVEPEKGKFAVFDDIPHAQGFCKPQQRRVVMLFTFDGDVLPQE
jgi:hypothetical protein